MLETVIRNVDGALVARIRVDSLGYQTICDINNRLLGRYDPNTDVTTDVNNALFSRGNALTALITA